MIDIQVTNIQVHGKKSQGKPNHLLTILEKSSDICSYGSYYLKHLVRSPHLLSTISGILQMQ